MVEEGTLVQTPGSHIKVADFVREVIDRFGMPHVIVCDRYRQRELVPCNSEFISRDRKQKPSYRQLLLVAVHGSISSLGGKATVTGY